MSSTRFEGHAFGYSSRAPTKRDAPVDRNSIKSPKKKIQKGVRQAFANGEEDYQQAGHLGVANSYTSYEHRLCLRVLMLRRLDL